MGYTAHYIHVPDAAGFDLPASLSEACVYRSNSGWLSAEYPELEPRFDRLAKQLSAELSRPVLSLAYYDDDMFHLRCYSERTRVADIEKSGDTPARTKGAAQLGALFGFTPEEETRLRKVLRCPVFSQQLDLLSELFGVMLLPALRPEQAATFEKGSSQYLAYLAQRAAEPKFKKANKVLIQSFPGKMRPVFSPERELPAGEMLITTELLNGAWSFAALRPYSLRGGQLVPAWDTPIDPHFRCHTPKVWSEEGVRSISSPWYGYDAGGKAVPGGCMLFLESRDGTFSLRMFLPDVESISTSSLIVSEDAFFFSVSSEKRDQLLLYRLSPDGNVQATACLGSGSDRVEHFELRNGRLYVMVNIYRGRGALMVFDPLQLNLLAQIQTPQSIYTEQAFQFNESETRLYCSCLLQNRLVAFDLVDMRCIYSQPATSGHLVVQGVDAEGRVYALNDTHIFIYDADFAPLYSCSCCKRGSALSRMAFEGKDAYFITVENHSAMWGVPQAEEFYFPEKDENGQEMLRRVEQRVISGGETGPWEYETYYYPKLVPHPPAGYTLFKVYENGLQAWGIPEQGEICVWRLEL